MKPPFLLSIYTSSPCSWTRCNPILRLALDRPILGIRLVAKERWYPALFPSKSSTVKQIATTTGEWLKRGWSFQADSAVSTMEFLHGATYRNRGLAVEWDVNMLARPPHARSRYEFYPPSTVASTRSVCAQSLPFPSNRQVQLLCNTMESTTRDAGLSALSCWLCIFNPTIAIKSQGYALTRPIVAVQKGTSFQQATQVRSNPYPFPLIPHQYNQTGNWKTFKFTMIESLHGRNTSEGCG